MRYGFCTGFATKPLFFIDESLEDSVSGWGFHYIEYPLISIAALGKDDFERLCARVEAAGIGCDSMCNLFPGSIHVIGKNVSEIRIRRYLDTAFERASFLGTEKVIFGSAESRRLGNYPPKNADQQFTQCLKILDEYGEKYHMTVLIEAIRRGEADYINTLSEAAEAIQRAKEAGCIHIGLMADIFHMESNGERLSDLEKHLSLIQHIHICEKERSLPSEDGFSSFPASVLSFLKTNNYIGTISYESVCPENQKAGKKLLKL